ncbi:MAG: peptidoglycan DD-metalloendopeptidase family protein [bacterium]|nr:peptidoglycan DD-metalloendopeptidase family protein [bacterium]
MRLNTIKNYSNSVKKVLAEYENIGRIIPKDFLETHPFIFDFTEKNIKLASIDLSNKEEFINYINNTLKNKGYKFGIGGYGENRIIYCRSNLFENNAEPRSVHLGVDIWIPTETPIYSPLPATVHSFQDNNNFGDYGPTIILEHFLNGVRFFALYGHLNRSSLKNLKEGMIIKQGQKIATLGDYDENGGWPSHLHFQIISNLLGKKGDFPGVATISEQKYYLTLCPDPDLILRLKT